MKIKAYKIIFLFLLFSCGASEQEKLSDETDKILAEIELSAKNRRDSIENLKLNIFNQPDSVYISESYKVYINNFFDSLFRSSCYGQSFGTDEGFVINNHLSNGTDEVIRFFDYDDTSRSSLSYNKFNKLVHQNNDLNILTKKSGEIFRTMYTGWDDEVRIIPVKFKLDSTILNLIKKDKNLPYYFKQSVLKNIPIFLLLRSKETNYKGNRFKDARLDKDQVGETYHYGEYEESGKVVSVSFMYLEPMNDDKTTKVVHYEHEDEYEKLRNTKYITSCLATTSIITYDKRDSSTLIPRKGAKGSIINGFFGFFEIGRIDQSIVLGSLQVLNNRYKFVEPAPNNLDINYSSGYFDYQNGADDISARLIKCISNIPMDLNYKKLLNFNGGYLHYEGKDNRCIVNVSYLSLFYSDKSIQIEDRD
jgi:hypothetical protein